MSSKVLQHRRGTSEQHASFVGAEGEFTYNTTEKTIHVHDGSTSGGIALAKKEYVDSTKTSLESQISSITSKYITKATADASYLGKTAKAASATTADSATKATQDGSGNTITSTYATKSALSAVETKANSAVKKVNGQTPDSSGNVVVDVPPSIHVGTSAPTDSDIEVWIDTDENQGSAVLTVNNVAPDSNGNVNVDAVVKSGDRGTLGGYNKLVGKVLDVTVNGSYSDDSYLLGTLDVTVEDGHYEQAWTKVIAIPDANSIVTLGSKWSWAGGEVPELKANSILVLKWCGYFGIANLVAGS